MKPSKQIAALVQRDVFGWKVPAWCRASGCSRSKTYELIASGEIDSRTLGRSRIILTHPADFLASLPTGEAA